jgi:DNA invertase Pin-like site-specific DNA recombinase
LLDLAGACDTLVADADGVYHPGLFKDRLLLGMKGIMSEAELHVLRARLEGGIRNKAARGELRRARRSACSGARPTGRSGSILMGPSPA